MASQQGHVFCVDDLVVQVHSTCLDGAMTCSRRLILASAETKGLIVRGAKFVCQSYFAAYFLKVTRRESRHFDYAPEVKPAMMELRAGHRSRFPVCIRRAYARCRAVSPPSAWNRRLPCPSGLSTCSSSPATCALPR